MYNDTGGAAIGGGGVVGAGALAVTGISALALAAVALALVLAGLVLLRVAAGRRSRQSAVVPSPAQIDRFSALAAAVDATSGEER